MHFFRTREVAEDWCEGRSGLAVLTVEEGFALARALDRPPARLRAADAAARSNPEIVRLDPHLTRSRAASSFL